jgi:hypothetical protein
VTGNTNLIELTFTSQSDKWKVRGDTKNFNDKFTLILLQVLNYQRHQISIVVQYNVALNDNSCTDISYEYSNTPILCSSSLHFLRFCALLWCWPNAHTNNVSQIL